MPSHRLRLTGARRATRLMHLSMHNQHLVFALGERWKALGTLQPLPIGHFISCTKMPKTTRKWGPLEVITSSCSALRYVLCT